jgi:hypothetical protein
MVPRSSSQGIFLSYRRQDAAPYARLLKSELGKRIPDAQVFMDLDSIEAGVDFAEVIREAVDSCAVLVALIGRQWATLVDEEGNRRLDNPDDFVRFEVQTALERGVRVIPVLVDGVAPLRQQQLPSELQKLARLNAFELSYGRYEYDADRLLGLIQRALAAVGDPAAARAGPPSLEPADTERNGNESPAAARSTPPVSPRGAAGKSVHGDDKPLQAAARARRRQRYFLICFIFSLILCSISMAGINEVPAFTVLSHTLGWIIGLSVAGALLSLILLVRALDSSSARQVVWAWVPVVSFSFLAFVPFLWLAIIRRRARDWAVFTAYLAAVAAEIILVYVGHQGSAAWSISYAMIPLVAGTATVHALMAFRPAAGVPSWRDAHAARGAGERQKPVMDAVAPQDLAIRHRPGPLKAVPHRPRRTDDKLAPAYLRTLGQLTRD